MPSFVDLAFCAGLLGAGGICGYALKGYLDPTTVSVDKAAVATNRAISTNVVSDRKITGAQTAANTARDKVMTNEIVIDTSCEPGLGGVSDAAYERLRSQLSKTPASTAEDGS